MKNQIDDAVIKPCGRCGDDLKDNFGGYSVDKLKSLCKKCWAEYIPMRNRHFKEELEWWRK